MINKNFYIYAYQDENGIPIYVGKGKERGWKMHERLFDHLKIAKTRVKPHPFYFKLRKMLQQGFIPKIYKIQEHLSGEEANKIEKEIILKFGRKDLGTGTLLNLSDGGQGILNMSQSHKDAISKRHTGKINSVETRKKISESKKGVPKSAEHRKKISNYFKGRSVSQETKEKRKNLVWIHKNKESKQIKKNIVQEFLDKGWILGRSNYMTKQISEKMSKSAKNRPKVSLETRQKNSKIHKNSIWINNGKINKFIYYLKAEKEYLSIGWEKGRVKKKSCWINNSIINKLINFDELAKYLSIGWKKGSKNRCQKTNNNLYWITNNFENKMISKSEPIENGWRKGRTLRKKI